MPFSSTSEISALDSQAQALMDWAPVPLGSILRVHAYSYGNWSIVVTPGNVEWLYSGSKNAYTTEWGGTDASLNAMIAEASEKAGLADANAVMNVKIGEYAVDRVSLVLRASTEPITLRIKDIGAGAGGTSSAFLRELVHRQELCDQLRTIKLELTLIEPSSERLETALRSVHDVISGTPLEQSVCIIPIVGSVRALLNMETDSADLIISNAAIHHESFNAHLPEIHRVLRPGAPFISGDWHEGTYETPARVYWMYCLFQAPQDDRAVAEVLDFVLGESTLPPDLTSRPELGKQQLCKFNEVFRLSDTTLLHAFDGLTQNERQASVGGMRYWLEIAKMFAGTGKRSPEVLLQCHERVSKRVEAMKNAGFVFDTESRSKYTELLRNRGFGELTVVMVAKKRQQRPTLL